MTVLGQKRKPPRDCGINTSAFAALPAGSFPRGAEDARVGENNRHSQIANRRGGVDTDHDPKPVGVGRKTCSKNEGGPRRVRGYVCRWEWGWVRLQMRDEP
jgi:hypothetical protein